MKAGIVVAIIGFCVALIGWVFGGGGIPHPAKFFPFLGGGSVSLYDFGGLVVVGMVIAGLLRLFGGKSE